MEHQQLIPHLFRTEFGRITAALCKRFGIEHMEVAEDIASETFLTAMEIWPFKGVPENPVAWLYTVARNKTRNQIIRNKLFAEKVLPASQQAESGTSEVEIDLSADAIADSQLQMLFALCHPSIPPEAQIGLSLRVLCGFGIDEIATAFLTNRETITKRLFRAREKLREEKVRIELPPPASLGLRLENVLTTLYLLFNEGYYSESDDAVLKKDLCLEAMRLTSLLIDSAELNKPNVNALLALMCFQASRFEARKNEHGELILYDDQDETKWNPQLITQGARYLHQASIGESISRYHLEATIAFWHTRKADTQEKWSNILQLYDQLLAMSYTPVAAMNRIVAYARVHGNANAIVAAEQLRLNENHFYHALLGELHRAINPARAKLHFEKALGLARTRADKQTIVAKLSAL